MVVAEEVFFSFFSFNDNDLSTDVKDLVPQRVWSMRVIRDNKQCTVNKAEVSTLYRRRGSLSSLFTEGKEDTPKLEVPWLVC